jgi:ribonucleoside-diphosphate reductase alpha chain
LPDGLSQIIDEYLRQHSERMAHPHEVDRELHASGYTGHTELFHPEQQPPLMAKIGDLCPECGEAAVVNEEGCRKCYACGYSEC